MDGKLLLTLTVCHGFLPARPTIRSLHRTATLVTPLTLPASLFDPAAFTTPANDDPVLSLDQIRKTLIRQEDSIIFALIERAQYSQNERVYAPAQHTASYLASGERISLLEYLLRETEQLYGKIRRYAASDSSAWKEHAFFPRDLPRLMAVPREARWLPAAEYLAVPEALMDFGVDVNVNDLILDLYVKNLVPRIASAGDDKCYGATATCDVTCLQALSRRIHFGVFVAEAKFRAHPAAYMPLIKAQDAAGLLALLTDTAIEERIVRRLKRKAAIFGQEIGDQEIDDETGRSTLLDAAVTEAGLLRLEPEALTELYMKWVMPLTKEVEVRYLLRRLSGN